MMSEEPVGKPQKSESTAVQMRVAELDYAVRDLQITLQTLEDRLKWHLTEAEEVLESDDEDLVPSSPPSPLSPGAYHLTALRRAVDQMITKVQSINARL